MKEKGEIRSTDLLDILHVAEQRIRRLLLELVNDGVLVAEGGNRNRVYRLNAFP